VIAQSTTLEKKGEPCIAAPPAVTMADPKLIESYCGTVTSWPFRCSDKRTIFASGSPHAKNLKLK
jgi:hypothetical protein